MTKLRAMYFFEFEGESDIENRAMGMALAVRLNHLVEEINKFNTVIHSKISHHELSGIETVK